VVSGGLVGLSSGAEGRAFESRRAHHYFQAENPHTSPPAHPAKSGQRLASKPSRKTGQ
jgi:hypothetical protein